MLALVNSLSSRHERPAHALMAKPQPSPHQDSEVYRKQHESGNLGVKCASRTPIVRYWALRVAQEPNGDRIRILPHWYDVCLCTKCFR